MDEGAVLVLREDEEEGGVLDQGVQQRSWEGGGAKDGARNRLITRSDRTNVHIGKAF